MALAKPYTVVDAAKQSEDIDRMLDELYREQQVGGSSVSATSGAAGARGPAGIPGDPGEDGDTVSAGVNRSGNPITVVEGGTSTGTFTTNGVLYGNTTGAIQVTSQGPAISVLTANDGAPSFSATPTLGTLTVTGAISGASLSTTGAAVIGATLTATGAISGASLSTTGALVVGTTFTATGAISGASLTVTGTLVASGAVTARTTLTATGAISGATLASTGATTVGTLLDISAAAAGQISFPATQNASASVNILDDYEEGSWTPTIVGSGGGSGQTYTRQIGRYVKVGKMVYAFCYVLLSAAGTVTGSLRIGGLPFTSDTTVNVYSTATMGYWTGLATAFVCLGGFVEVNTTQIEINGATGATTGLKVALVQADIGDTSGFMARVAYLATA